MATRNRDLRPDAKVVTALTSGGTRGGTATRNEGSTFNLGTDRKEAERRLARIREHYEDNCRVVKRDVWSEQALGFAKEIARGERRIVYPTFSDVIDQDDPLLEFAQMHHNIREMYPSVEFVADTQLYGESNELNKKYVSENLKALEGDLRQEGALPPNAEPPHGRSSLALCMKHKRRNIKAHLPEKHHAELDRQLAAAYQAESYDEARKSLETTAKWLSRLNPDGSSKPAGGSGGDPDGAPARSEQFIEAHVELDQSYRVGTLGNQAGNIPGHALA